MCWRACVVWRNNRAVNAICSTIVLATFGELFASSTIDAGHASRRSIGPYHAVLGVIDSAHGCLPIQAELSPSDITSLINPVGTMFEDLPIGVAACVLSLSTNVLATFLIAYKAWCVSSSTHGDRS